MGNSNNSNSASRPAHSHNLSLPISNSTRTQINDNSLCKKCNSRLIVYVRYWKMNSSGYNYTNQNNTIQKCPQCDQFELFRYPQNNKYQHGNIDNSKENSKDNSKDKNKKKKKKHLFTD